MRATETTEDRCLRTGDLVRGRIAVSSTTYDSTDPPPLFPITEPAIVMDYERARRGPIVNRV